MKSKRIWELDFLRGLSIILMVFDHLMYDLQSLPYWFSNFFILDRPVANFLYEAGHWYWNSELRANFHFVFVAIFLLVSGISYNFSRSNLKRGLRFTVVALLITAITMGIQIGFGVDIGIVFGIIHMFAIGTLLVWLFKKIWDNDAFIFIVGAFIIAYGFYFNFTEVPYYNTLDFPKLLEVIVGIKGYGADHFGIFPYVGVIFIGTVLGKHLYQGKASLLPSWDKSWNKPFVFAGKYTLWIFVTHQIIIMALVYIIGYISGFRI
ncbi:MAG: DUF1624 domain-containing protein [Firmicutes bacterium]|nr:DUF1624 domain-containing protein [Bacillota bacterium]